LDDAPDELPGTKRQRIHFVLKNIPVLLRMGPKFLIGPAFAIASPES